MNTCSRCNNDLHRDFPDKTERCSGCDRTPTWCRCVRVESKRVPAWLRNLPARDETGALVA